MMLGRNRSISEIPKLKMSNYRGVLPTPPATCDYTGPAQKTLRNVYLNDQYGDCVIAAGCHFRGVTSANAGSEVGFSNSDVLKMYKIIGGGGDNGADLSTAMRYWSSSGFTDGVKLMGWLSVDPTDPVEYRTAMWLFENLYYGIECPNQWFSPMPQRDDFTWDMAGSPVPRNGHSWVAVGYNDRGTLIDTWGLIGVMTDEAHAKYASRNAGGELYVMVSPDMIGKAQVKAPNGMNWHQLIEDFNALGGNLPVPPDLQPQLIDWADII